MTSAKKQAERRVRAITASAGEDLRHNREDDFLGRFPGCDVSLKYTWRRVVDGVEVESDLFASACYGISIRQKDDLARLVAEGMIRKGMDLRSHRTNKTHGFTTLMMAAISCEIDVIKLLLPFSNVDATTTSGGQTAAELAIEMGKHENAECIKAFKLGRAEEQELADLIPVPPPRPAKSIDH
jgi:hypothetical protein